MNFSIGKYFHTIMMAVITGANLGIGMKTRDPLSFLIAGTMFGAWLMDAIHTHWMRRILDDLQRLKGHIDANQKLPRNRGPEEPPEP